MPSKDPHTQTIMMKDIAIQELPLSIKEANRKDGKKRMRLI